MPTVRARDGIALHYEVCGSGTTVLGIHGSPSSAVLWEDAAVQLASVGRCVVYDRRGYGRSGYPEPFERTDLSEQTGDALAVLAAVSPEPAVLIGRSTGGLIALAMAHARPERVRALVLLEPALFSIDPQAQAWATWLRRAVLSAADDDPGRASEAVICNALGDNTWDEFPHELQDLFTSGSAAVLAEICGNGLDLSGNPLTLTKRELANIEQPALLMSGEDSPEPLRRVADRLAAVLPGARKVEVPGGHLINPAHPAVLEFVARVG